MPHYVSHRELDLASAANGLQLMLAAALFGLSIIGLIRERKHVRMRELTEPVLEPDGDPPTLFANSENTERLPSVD